jgi:hypothetical protein
MSAQKRLLMVRMILLIIAFSLASLVNGQMRRNIEVDLHVRYEKHADFTTRFFERTYTDQVKLWGLSNGVNINFLQPISNKIKFKVGVGYYKLAMDKVRQSTRINTLAPGRTIDFEHPTGIKPVFYTDYYYYNNLALTGGLSYEAKLNKQWNFNVGGDLNYLYSFSQFYNIDYDNSKFRTRNGKSLGFGVNTYFGIIKRFQNDKYYLNPKVILPIYQELRGDQVFGENRNLKMDKWFNGGGLSITIGKYL